ncbi:transposase [Bacillus sp. 2205SS5-2]|uniref:transposase n=1 Tax=Bacillus sp. 2205SS5-2 TaxID=3109031 RepID=UPI003006BDF1
MPRTARKKSSTNTYHMIIRGINRQTIFEEQEDAVMFLQILNQFKEKSGYKIYGYCLMGNHIHILIKEKEDLGIAMRRIGASFVYWYNLKYERCGHLFQGRYKSKPVEDRSYLLNVLRYIHQNPVKAGLVSDISKYQWSSYSEYVNFCKVVDRDLILGLFHQNREKAISLFSAFHQKQDEGDFLSIIENKRLSDQNAQEIINNVCHVKHSTDLQKLTNRELRDRYLRALKNKELSVRQLARLTGISRGVITKA